MKISYAPIAALAILLIQPASAGAPNVASCPTNVDPVPAAIRATEKSLKDISLGELARILNRETPGSPAYKKAIAEWPANVQIWPHLTGYEARYRFLQYLLETDDTRSRNYQTFDNLCTGYASQFYGRYSSRAQLSADSIARLKGVGVDAAPRAAKWKVPMRMMSYPGHFFTAVEMDERYPDDVRWQVLVDPTSGEVIRHGTEKFNHHAGRMTVERGDLVSFSADKKFEFAHEDRYFRTASGIWKSVPKREVAYLSDAFLISERGEMHYNFHIKNQTFGQYIAKQTQNMRLNDEDLVQAATLVVGREIKLKPDATPQVLTTSAYCAYIGRQDLCSRIGEAVRSAK